MFRFFVLWAVLAWAAPALAAPPPAPPPLEAYGRGSAVEEVEISPSGDRLAYVGVAGEKRRLVIQTLDGKLIKAFDVGAAKLRDLQWGGVDHLLITTSTTASVPGVLGRHEWFQVLSYNVPRAKTALLMDTAEEGALNVVMGQPFVARHRGEAAVFVRGFTASGEGSYDLFRVDPDTGAGRVHAEGGSDTVDWVVDPQGAAVARSEYADKRGRWRLLLRGERGVWREALAQDAAIERPNLMGLGRDGASVVVAKLMDDEWRLVEVSLRDGSASLPIDDERQVEQTLFDDATGRLMAIRYRQGPQRYQFFDPDRAAAWRKVAGGFRGKRLTLTSWTPDFRRLVLYVEGDRDPGSYYVVDMATLKADEFLLAYPSIPPEAVAPVRTVTYKAADGLPIEAVLTLPVGREAKGLPLVVLPHGGPASHDEPVFDWWSQAIASRGYAVLQPNFRGSTGYGRAFSQKGYGEWGRKMQTDLSDGVRHLADQGMIDPKRVCIVGASYGGYAALAGATLDRGVYRCAVSVNGVSDLPRMLLREARERGTSNSSTVRYWSRFMGAEFRQRSELEAVSPAQQAARADAPVLLIHGRDDTVVPFEQSSVMARALERAGKPVELVTLAGEDHWLSRENTRMQMLSSTVVFLERHNPPR
jgi:dipeptidyl aminopeptidase/acylaminoacyl peptidase